MGANTTIRQFIVDNFLYGRANLLGDDDSFLESGILDSTGVLELISFLEKEYDILVEDNELVPENLDSINCVARFVAAKRACAQLTYRGNSAEDTREFH